MLKVLRSWWGQSKKQQRAYRPCLETMEERLTPTTYHWSPAVNQLEANLKWSVAVNWYENAVPDSTADVVFSTGYSDRDCTIDMGGSTPICRSLVTTGYQGTLHLAANPTVLALDGHRYSTIGCNVDSGDSESAYTMTFNGEGSPVLSDADVTFGYGGSPTFTNVTFVTLYFATGHINGTITLDNATIQNGPGDTSTNSMTWTAGTINLVNAGQVVNNSAFYMNYSGTVTADITEPAFINNKSLEVAASVSAEIDADFTNATGALTKINDSATLTLTAAASNSGDLRLGGSSATLASNETIYNATNSLITGSGTVAANVDTAGKISPGIPGGTGSDRVGWIVVDGDLNIAQYGGCSFDVWSLSNYDIISVTGDFTISSSTNYLIVVLLNNYKPAPSTTFPVLPVAGSTSGTFSSTLATIPSWVPTGSSQLYTFAQDWITLNEGMQLDTSVVPGLGGP
jgi:hypothetical protein